MMTSALALSQVLTMIVMHRGSGDRFLSVAADKLGLSSEDREAEALLYLSRSIRNVRKDIDSLPFAEDQKELLRNQIAVFSPIADFSHAHLVVDQAKVNSLTDRNLVGLTHIHMALSGFARFPEINQTNKELASEFRELRDEVASSDVPDYVKKLILDRINQIAAILDHLAFFGVRDLEKELESLAGSLVVNKPAIAENSPGVGQKVLLLLSKGFKFADTVNKSVDVGQASLENGREIYGLLEGMF